jgi:acyl-CoA thioesterase I
MPVILDNMKHVAGTILFLLFIKNSSAQDTVYYSKPVFVSTSTTNIPVHSSYSYRLHAIDSASLPLSFLIRTLPSWLQFNEATKTISGKAVKAGQYFISIEVNNQHAKAVQSFMLTVSDKKTSNILCLGNSITNGTNKYNSFRRRLWQLLHAGKYNFDFIGSWDKHHMGGEVPDPDFDMDHDGHSGWRFDDVFHPPSWDSARGNIIEWLKIYKPDMVLLELGTNDVFQCRTVSDMMKDLDRLIILLRKKNKGVKIFLAQIPPLGKQWAQQKLCGDSTDYDHAIRNLNRAFADFAKDHSLKRSPLIIVDQYNGINTDTEMYDDIHPNEEGEKKMAQKWFNAINQYLAKLN